MGLVVLEHRVIGLVVPKQEGSGLAVLGHKFDTLVSLGCRVFVIGALGQQDYVPVDPRKEDSTPTTIGFDLDPVLARVDLFDMYTRVAATQVCFAIARANLSVEKFVLGAVEVGPTRAWIERYAEHTASAIAQLVVTVERTNLVVVANDLSVG